MQELNSNCGLILDGDKVRRLLFEKRLTQVKLAELCGVTPGAISLFLSGKTTPSLATALKIAACLGANIEDITSRLNVEFSNGVTRITGFPKSEIDGKSLFDRMSFFPEKCLEQITSPAKLFLEYFFNGILNSSKLTQEVKEEILSIANECLASLKNNSTIPPADKQEE